MKTRFGVGLTLVIASVSGCADIEDPELERIERTEASLSTISSDDAITKIKFVRGRCDPLWYATDIALFVAVGDLDRDGRTDLAVVDTRTSKSISYRSGATGKPLSVAGLTLGWPINSVRALDRDLDQDGRTDFVVIGQDTSDAEGGTAGSTSQRSHLAIVSPGKSKPIFGVDSAAGAPQVQAAAVIEDRNGDGKLDLALSFAQNGPGFVTFHAYPSGTKLGALPAPPGIGNFFGTAILGVPQSRTADLLVVGDPSARTFTGAAFAFPDAASARSPSWTSATDTQSQLFGDVLLSPGDLNGDGINDIVVGAHSDAAKIDFPIKDYRESTGRVVALNGKTGTRLWVRNGHRLNENFGNAVASTDDIDGDGVKDLLVGAPSPGRPLPIFGIGGRFSVVSGRTGAILIDAEEIVATSATSGKLGSDLASLGVSGKTVDLAVSFPGSRTGSTIGLRCQP